MLFLSSEAIYLPVTACFQVLTELSRCDAGPSHQFSFSLVSSYAYAVAMSSYVPTMALLLPLLAFSPNMRTGLGMLILMPGGGLICNQPVML